MALVTHDKPKCRVIVLGSSRPRLQKVTSLLLGGSYSTPSGNEDQKDAESFREGRDGSSDDSVQAVTIEYLPCIPVFGFYNDRSSGQPVRYLARVDYLGRDGSLWPPGTLLSFVDESTTSMRMHEEDESSDDNDRRHDIDGSVRADEAQGGASWTPQRSQDRPMFGPISGVAVVDALSEESRTMPDMDWEDQLRHDVDRVSAFLTSMLPHHCGVAVEVMPPEPAFHDLHEEMAAFMALTVDEKRDASARTTMGPGKMARFVKAFAERLVHGALEERRKQQEQQQKMEVEANQALNGTQDQAGDVQQSLDSTKEVPLDPTKNRYACRTCRFALFVQDDLQSPPHVPSRHHFSHKKQRGSTTTSSQYDSCQSIFLQSGRPWMGSMSDVEGKLSCPKCDAKVGSWNWSGAQCSCGTWIVPAIQVPRSRVDVVPPANQPEPGHLLVTGLPPGTVVSPVVLKRLQKGEANNQHESMPSQLVLD